MRCKDAVQQILRGDPGRGHAGTVPDQPVHRRWRLGITGFVESFNILERERDNPGEVKLMDMWGFNEAQETSEVSPEMVKEFLLPSSI